MAARRLRAVALAALVALAGLVTVLVLVRGGKDEQPSAGTAGTATTGTTGTRPARLIVQPPIRVPGGIGAATSFDRPARLFGDAVGAHVEVLVDRRLVDPDSVRVRAGFAPWRFIAPPVSERSDLGKFVWLNYHYRLLCLRRTCRPPPSQARTFSFPDVRIVFRRVTGRERSFNRSWPPLVVSSRMKRDDLQRGGFRAREFPLPGVSYRIAPGPLFAGLVGGAALAALAGGFLIWFGLAPLVRARLQRARLLSELERELALLLESLEGDEVGRRTALDRLSGALRRAGDAQLAGNARRLAWSEDGPSAPEVETLAGAVEDRIGGSA